jgi:site-specific DNA-methyltransferase (adenine-specific)
MEIKNQIFNDDCLDFLQKQVPDNYFDALITDPPYGLSDHNEKIIKETLLNWLNGKDDYIPKIKGFMGQNWDGFVPSPKIWKEIYRVLKPGSYGVVFAGNRTLDLMSISLRLVGFKIKDILFFLYGSGFPKGFNIEKGLKKLGYKEESEKYFDFKTCLKPAYEPIILIQKEMSEKNVCLNILKWGTGGLNIGKCRIGNEVITTYDAPVGTFAGENSKRGLFKNYKQHIGRYPANIIYECSCNEDEILKEKLLIKQKGAEKTTGGFFKKSVEKGKPGGNTYIGGKQLHLNINCIGNMLDNQGKNISRFFYSAKANKNERLFYCKICNDVYSYKEIENHIHRENIKGGHRIIYNFRDINAEHIVFHPTQKNLNLMRWLVRLIVPENGIVLDPFLGTGTTAIACLLENCNYIGIEKNDIYFKISQKRLNLIKKNII